MSRDTDELNVAIGGNLRKLRLQRGMSLGAISRIVGTTYQQVQKYETGRDRLSARNLYVLARFFKVDIDAFYQGFEVAAPAPEITSTAARLDRIARDQPKVARELFALIIALAASVDLNQP